MGGSNLCKKTDEISLLAVYKAINEGESEREVFDFHPNPNTNCPLGSKIHTFLKHLFENVQKAMENEMSKTTLANLLSKLS